MLVFKERKKGGKICLPNIKKVSWSYHAYIDCVRRTRMFLTFGQVVNIGHGGKSVSGCWFSW